MVGKVHNLGFNSSWCPNGYAHCRDLKKSLPLSSPWRSDDKKTLYPGTEINSLEWHLLDSNLQELSKQIKRQNRNHQVNDVPLGALGLGRGKTSHRSVDPHRHQELRNGATRNGGCKALYTGSRISPQWTCLLWHASRLWTGATGRNKELYPRQDLNRSMQSTTRGRLWAKMWCFFFLKPRFIWLKFIKYDLLEISST